MIKGSCHCGAINFEYPGEPEWLTSCNCSICRRLGTLWAYAKAADVKLDAAVGSTIDYMHGDRTLVLHSCATCGCTTHWSSANGDATSRMAVNFRMCDPDDIEKFPVRHFDGAKSWSFLD